MRLIRYRADSRDELLGVPVYGLATMDPGARGALLVWERLRLWPTVPDQVIGLGSKRLTLRPRYRAASLLLVEGQYVGVNAASSMRLAFAAGMEVGRYWSQSTPLLRATAVIAPRTWQGVLPKGTEGVKERARKHVHSRVAGFLDGMSAALAEGATDAWCMADWYMTLRGSQ